MIIVYAFLGSLIAFLGTIIGSSFVFFTKKILENRTQKLFLGFASGVMIAASIWSLLLPAADYSELNGVPKILPMSLGFLAGAGFLLLMDKFLPHIHPGSEMEEGMASKATKTTHSASVMTPLV